MRRIPFIIVALTLIGTALVAQAYEPLVPLPGTLVEGTTQTNLNQYLAGGFKLLIALSGVIAVMVAIAGGVQYVAAGINPSAKSNAKERIEHAFVGIALVLSSYLILNTINPKLVEFNLVLPPIGKVPAAAVAPEVTPAPPSAPVCPTPNDNSAECCPSGVSCTACSSCSLLSSSGVPYKPCGVANCYLSGALLYRIQNIYGVTGWRITESWPPTVDHISSCHKNGTCADINNTGGATDPKTIKTYYDAFRRAGLNVLYESTDCGPYTTVGISCKAYPTMTNTSSFHVKI